MKAYPFFTLMFTISTLLLSQGASATQEITCYYKVKAGGRILKKASLDNLKEFGNIVVLSEISGLPPEGQPTGKVNAFEYTVQQINVPSIRLNSVSDWLEYRSQAKDIEFFKEQFSKVGASNPEVTFSGCKIIELLMN